MFFSPRSNWNTKIAVAGHPSKLLDRLAALRSFNLNQDKWSVNVAVAPRGCQRVSAVNPDGWRMDSVPMVHEAVGTPDSDAHLVIIDGERNVVWNFQGDTRNTGRSFEASAFGVFRLDGPGWYNPNRGGPWTGRSSNACLLGGLILPDELRSGAISHALALGIDGSLLADMPVLPAKTTDDGGVVGGLPNGSRIQLDPNFDILSLPGKEARIVAKALQDYGAFVVERTTGVALYFQSTCNDCASYAGMDFTGLLPGLFKRCLIIPPTRSYEYDFPARFDPPTPYREA